MALELGLRLQVLFKDPNISIFFETQGQGKTGVAETGNTWMGQFSELLW